MDPSLNKLTIERTAHVYTLGNNGLSRKNIWIVFHGYGQLASRIIRKFDQLDLSDTLVVAPEGISKFYFKREPLILGATWMTSQHREDEIHDYLHYLDKVYDTYAPSGNVTLNVLGFSQGCTTMLRWLDHRRPAVNKMIMWAGQFPHDMDYSLFKDYFSTIKERYYCVGDHDNFMTPERVAQFKSLLEEHQFELEIKKFEGKHVIDRNLLGELVV